MTQKQYYGAPENAQVSTVHILSSGEVITTLNHYMEVESRFSWVDRKLVITKLLEMRKLTDSDKTSILAIYEEGQFIRQYMNVEKGFKPLAYW